MSHVLNLIANPVSRGLTPALANAACVAVGGKSVDWLGEGTACDIALPADIEPSMARDKARIALGTAAVDANVIATANRRKKLLIADMDSTLIGQECIDELGDVLGIKPQIAAITDRSMRGELPFEAALRERVALLKGVTRQQIDHLVAERITLTPGARAAVQTMRRNGAYTAIVSGGFTLFTAHVAAQLGMHEHRSNELLFNGNVLAGAVAEPILGRDAKRATLLELVAAHGLTVLDALAVGDGANDLAMIREAGLGVAFRAKPIVAAEADAWISHNDLTPLLYLQGYRQDEISE